ncbi:MAG: hypothetical protein LBG96_13720 [Tannerella sp.]|nr:hypothetical protein [Tannerella sp.]
MFRYGYVGAYIDRESLSIPHYFEMGNYLAPCRKNSIAIRIDNTKSENAQIKAGRGDELWNEKPCKSVKKT